MAKYIFIVGGVISGLGKGITAASVGRMLMGRGLKVTNLKIDAYVNLDAGTMNPTEHGEVFVTDDGIETDQDIGNYERFLGKSLSRLNYATTGQIYLAVIDRERNLDYGGKCVEVVPDIPEEIIRRIENAAKADGADVAVIEIGGTVGEYQNILFIEAARLMKYRYQKDVQMILVSYVPIPGSLGEMKTKPTQYASRTLNESGIQADFIICRGSQAIDEPRKRKIALLCNMHSWDDIISAPDVDNIYRVPLVLKEQKLDDLILTKFGLHPAEQDLAEWRYMMDRIDNMDQTVRIGILGKYFTTGTFVLADVYVSVIEAIKHGCWAAGVKPELTWLDSEEYERNPEKLKELSRFHGVVIPGGFGTRGVEGIISSITYLRENNIPFLGLCYGLQLAVVEYARNVCGMKGAHTTEIDRETPYPVISLMPEQVKKLLGEGYGGTMRLGSYPCAVKESTLAFEVYSSDLIRERHRHRYEVNNEYRNALEERGLVISGIFPEGNLVEIVELPRDRHPFFIGVQFHPEFKSRPLQPHPLFKAYARACAERSIPRMKVSGDITPQPVEPALIEIGSSLQYLIEPGSKNQLWEKLMSMERMIADDLGVVLPPLSIQVNPALDPGAYTIKIRGTSRTSGELVPDKVLAVASEERLRELKGEPAIEPGFNLTGKWIARNLMKKATRMGCSVMEPEEVLISHCSVTLRNNIAELVGRQEVKTLVENLKKTYPTLVNSVFSEGLKLGKLTKIVRNLVRESVSVRDLSVVLETIADNLDLTQDVEILTECVRASLSRSIAGKFMTEDGTIDVITLEPGLEQQVANALYKSDAGVYLALDPATGHEILRHLDGEIVSMKEAGRQPVILVAPQIRAAFRKLTERPFPELAVLSWNEVPSDVCINAVSMVLVEK